jgi:hypothetical protein
LSIVDDDPRTVREAVDSEDGNLWKRAMEEEMESLDKNKAWDLVELSTRRNPIGNKWVFKKKLHAEGKVEKYKARLVARGYSEVEGIDFGNNKEIIQDVKTQFSSKFDMKDLSALNFILGMEIKRDWKKRKLWLNQRKYVETILQRFNMQECKPIKVHISIGVKLYVGQCPKTHEEE